MGVLSSLLDSCFRRNDIVGLDAGWCGTRMSRLSDAGLVVGGFCQKNRSLSLIIYIIP